MRAADIVTQLRLLLPQRTPEFTTNIPILSLTRSGTTMTAQCQKAHEMVAGDAVVIVGAVTQISIDSLTRSGVIGQLEITTGGSGVHDLTDKIATEITISGATESEFNGTFTRLEIPNRKTVTFTMANSGATVATGSPVLENGESPLRQYDSVYSVLETPTTASFTFTQSKTDLEDPIGTIIARTKPRISAGIDPNRLAAAYTKEESGELWLFVVLGRSESSKNRQILSDAQDNIPRGTNYRQQILQPFTIYTFSTVTDEIAATEARDLAADLFRPICRSLLGKAFDSGFFVGAQGPVHFVTHDVFDYDGSVYVHSYDFEQVADLTFDDTIGPDEDVAFRNIDYTIDPNLGGTTVLTGSIDLDETPVS